MEELLSDLNKFNVKTEEEIFVEQFSKLSADTINNNKSTENQPTSSNQYATHKMFGKDIPHSITPLNQENINLNANAIGENIGKHQFENNNDYTEIVGWNQIPKVVEDEDWSNLPDVNTSVDPNHLFGMTSFLSSEILNLGNANVNQQRIFGSNYMKNQSDNSKSDSKATSIETDETNVIQGFATDDNFKSSN